MSFSGASGSATPEPSGEEPSLVEFVIKEGFLDKRGSKIKSWRRRLFVLTNERLRYHVQYSYEPPKGEIMLKTIQEVRHSLTDPSEAVPSARTSRLSSLRRASSVAGLIGELDSSYLTVVMSTGRELLLKAQDDALAAEWAAQIRHAVARVNSHETPENLELKAVLLEKDKVIGELRAKVDRQQSQIAELKAKLLRLTTAEASPRRLTAYSVCEFADPLGAFGAMLPDAKDDRDSFSASSDAAAPSAVPPPVPFPSGDGSRRQEAGSSAPAGVGQASLGGSESSAAPPTVPSKADLGGLATAAPTRGPAALARLVQGQRRAASAINPAPRSATDVVSSLGSEDLQTTTSRALFGSIDFDARTRAISSPPVPSAQRGSGALGASAGSSGGLVASGSGSAAGTPGTAASVSESVTDVGSVSIGPSGPTPGSRRELFEELQRHPSWRKLLTSLREFAASVKSTIDTASESNGHEVPLGLGNRIAGQQKDFMLRLSDWLHRHPLVRNQLEALIEYDNKTEGGLDPHDIIDDLVDYARNELEKYLMTLLHPLVFSVFPEDAEADEELFARLRQLQFLNFDDFEIPEACRNEVTLSVAQGELAKINTYQTPEDKLKAVNQCFQFLSSALQLTSRSKGDTSGIGADDLLPVFIFVVLRANVPRLASNVAYIERFRHPSELMSQVGYSFVNLRSAIYYLQNLDQENLKISKEEWDRRLASSTSAGRPAPETSV